MCICILPLSSVLSSTTGINTCPTTAASSHTAIYCKIENVLLSFVVICFEFGPFPLLSIVVLSQIFCIYFVWCKDCVKDWCYKEFPNLAVNISIE